MSAAARFANCGLILRFTPLCTLAYFTRNSIHRELDRHSRGIHPARPACHQPQVNVNMTPEDQELIRRLKRIFFKDGNSGKRRLAQELRRIADLCELTSHPAPEPGEEKNSEAAPDDEDSSGFAHHCNLSVFVWSRSVHTKKRAFN